MSKHLVPWKRSVKGYKTGCQKVKHRFGPIKAGLMCLLSLSPTPFILVVPPGSCRGWTPAPRGWWILYINNKYPHDRKSSCCWHISCGVSMRWGELVWTLSPCFPHWRPGVRGTGLCVCVCVCVCVSVFEDRRMTPADPGLPPAPQAPTQAQCLLEASLTTWHPVVPTLSETVFVLYVPSHCTLLSC